jgi:sugar lactone lactonase YvrE
MIVTPLITSTDGATRLDPDITVLVGAPAALLGESPVWHPTEQVLYWCDIPGRQLHRHDTRTHAHRQWPLHADPGCVIPVAAGGVLVAMRDGVYHCDGRADGLARSHVKHGVTSVVSSLASRAWPQVAGAPYDTRTQRFNDGRADAAGRLWVGTIHEPRDAALAHVWCLDAGACEALVQAQQRPTTAAPLDTRWTAMASGLTVANGLAFSPDNRRLHLTDTTAHAMDVVDFDVRLGTWNNRRPFARFASKAASDPLSAYGGRPDGAAMDEAGCCWVAMYEGARLLRLSPQGDVVAVIELPVRCPTMPCLGGPDRRTLYVTTARDKRPEAELAKTPWAGHVLCMRVDVPGVAVHCANMPASLAR